MGRKEEWKMKDKKSKRRKEIQPKHNNKKARGWVFSCMDCGLSCLADNPSNHSYRVVEKVATYIEDIEE